MHRGYVKLWRKTLDSGLMQMPNTLAVFMYILLNAAHSPIKVGTKTGVVELQPGEYIGGRKQLAEKLGQPEQSIRTAILRLKQLDIITSKSTSKHTIYTIVNYSNYQSTEEYLTSKSTNNQPESKPAINQQSTTKQELKNLNNTSASSKILLSADGVWENISSQQMEVWQRAYPALSLDAELAKAAAWILANPKNKKSNYNRFLTNWFSFAQDKAPRVSEPQKRGLVL